MRKAPTRTRKARGRPSTGAESVHLRVLPHQFAAIDSWIAGQKEPGLSRPEAIRRLLEIALLKSDLPKRRRTAKQSATGAAELAARTIDKHLDPKAPAEEREVRRRKLVEGPSVFRGARKDQPG